MFDRYIREKIESKNASGTSKINQHLDNLPSLGGNYDLVIGNLEGPITENKSISLISPGKYSRTLLFTFPTSSIALLKDLNIRAVNLANNHTDNFYYSGYRDTLKFLDAGGITHFGSPYNSTSTLSTTLCQKDVCITLIGYNKFTKNNDAQIISDEIKKLKNDKSIDFIVVMPHWGEEYDLTSNALEQKYGRKWLAEGADLIVGTHPHVIQEIEKVGDKYIFYSLGNYIFDQWFNPDVSIGMGGSFVFKKNENKNGIEKSISLSKINLFRTTKNYITHIWEDTEYQKYYSKYVK
jgi:poly-gamma-glutamate synthesis protein (capsule biosynthesis protein)